MRSILILALLFQFSLLIAQPKTTKGNENVNNNVRIEALDILVKDLEANVETLESTIIETNKRQQSQENINEKTINGISAQISASSYNLTIFGLLFAILAIILGVYITRIESKVVRISEENKLLHNQTLKHKEEVVEINNLIQKDILGLYKKIRREETVHLLNRLLEVPEDVTHLQGLLLSRTLEVEDYEIVKKAYLEIIKQPVEPRALFSTTPTYKDSYLLIFFQHFIDLAIMDKEVNKEMSGFLETGVRSCFKNDILKSTTDFMNALIKLGYSKKNKEINNYIKGISSSKFKDFDMVYEIIFTALNNRTDQFHFFNLITDDKDCRIGKANYGKFLSGKYSEEELIAEEKMIFDKTQAIFDELEAEEKAKIEAEEKKKAEAEERKRKQNLKK